MCTDDMFCHKAPHLPPAPRAAHPARPELSFTRLETSEMGSADAERSEGWGNLVTLKRGKSAPMDLLAGWQAAVQTVLNCEKVVACGCMRGRLGQTENCK